IMSFPIQSRAIGDRETKRRKISPRATTVRPESQTIFNTGGTLRSAARRSCHPLQKLSCLVMVNEEVLRAFRPKFLGGGIHLLPFERCRKPQVRFVGTSTYANPEFVHEATGPQLVP